MRNSRTENSAEAGSAGNDRRSGFSLLGVLLSLTVTAILGSVSLFAYKHLRGCQEYMLTLQQSVRAVAGIKSYKDYYGFWPSHIREDGTPSRKNPSLPVGIWFSTTRYNYDLFNYLSGETNSDRNPDRQCFIAYTSRERHEGFKRFWLYLRGEYENPEKILNQLKKQTGQSSCAEDRVRWDEDIVVYVPNPNEILEEPIWDIG